MLNLIKYTTKQMIMCYKICRNIWSLILLVYNSILILFVFTSILFHQLFILLVFTFLLLLNFLVSFFFFSIIPSSPYFLLLSSFQPIYSSQALLIDSTLHLTNLLFICYVLFLLHRQYGHLICGINHRGSNALTMNLYMVSEQILTVIVYYYDY